MPVVVVRLRLEAEAPAVISTSAVAFRRIEPEPELPRFAPAVTVPAKTEIEPDEVMVVEIVTLAAFWVAPETVPPVPDWPIVTLPMLPPFTPVLPLIDQVLSKVCADANEAEPVNVPAVALG